MVEYEDKLLTVSSNRAHSLFDVQLRLKKVSRSKLGTRYIVKTSAGNRRGEAKLQSRYSFGDQTFSSDGKVWLSIVILVHPMNIQSHYSSVSEE
jgi:hypothetical protein